MHAAGRELGEPPATTRLADDELVGQITRPCWGWSLSAAEKTENCVACCNEASCIFPLAAGADSPPDERVDWKTRRFVAYLEKRPEDMVFAGSRTSPP